MDFRVNDCTYRMTSRLNAKTQFSILQKISPLLASGFGQLAPLLIQLKQEGVANVAEMTLAQLSQIATPVARELAAMSDADRDYILGTLLSVVERKRDGEIGWAKVWSPEVGRSMFDDVNNDFTVMLRIALGVFQETFSAFLPASLSNLTGSKVAALRSIQ